MNEPLMVEARKLRTWTMMGNRDSRARPKAGPLDGMGPRCQPARTDPVDRLTMTQNIYDNPDFFAGYSKLGRSVEGLAGAAEWPTLRAMLPDPRGRAVVDLGCGFGWFCRWAREQHAARVLGVDVSENMLARARAETADDAIVYERADLETVVLPRASFDLAYSSLTLHYVRNLDGVIAKVRDALVDGGRFVFSVEHPIFTAPSHPGWVVDADGRKTWPVDSYLLEGPRETDWLARGVIKQHRTLGSYLNALLARGFAISRVEEWGPDAAQIAARPEWADERQRPPFLLVSAVRTV
jgi:SAM-dependent methyltransferase